MRRPALVAVPNQWEGALVETLAASRDVEVVRRCADVAELLSAAAAGLAEIAFVASDLRMFDRSALADMRRHGVRVVGVARPGDEEDERALRRWGVTEVLAADADVAAVSELLAGSSSPEGLGGLGADGVHPDRREAEGSPYGPGDEPAGEGAADPDPAPGRLIAVWGPTGAPGRSAIALTLAAEAARLGVPTLLVDADPYGGVQAQALSLLDESPGLAAALRAADQGTLDVPGLAERCLRVAPNLSVLTGIPRADRWPELRPDPFEHLLSLARAVVSFVVVDCGFCLEDDEELSYDTAAPRRNAATLTALGCADHVVVVGAGDPIGLQRLVRGLQELGTVRAPAQRTVLVNRVRASAVGANPHETIAAALERFSGVQEACFVPEDRDSFDRALLQGRTLSECAPDSAARQVLADLTARLLGVDRLRRTSEHGRRRWRRVRGIKHPRQVGTRRRPV